MFVWITQEARWRYYLEKGLTLFSFGPPTSGSAFSVSSRVKSTSSEAVATAPDLGSGFPIGGPTVDGVPATNMCSLCAARLELDAQDYEEECEATSEGLGRAKRKFLPRPSILVSYFSVPFRHGFVATPSLSRHCATRDQKKRKRISRRVRRLEEMVESLSHGLISALTELKEFRGRITTADGRKADDSGVVDELTTAFSSLSSVVDHPDSTVGASAPAEQPDSITQYESATQHIDTKFGENSASRESKLGGPSSVVSHNATGNDSSFFIRDNRSPISGLLRPILDFMTCPEVFRFLKWAEAHPGLRSTQLFDLFWVSDNLFNVHRGVRYHQPVGGVISL